MSSRTIYSRLSVSIPKLQTHPPPCGQSSKQALALMKSSCFQSRRPFASRAAFSPSFDPYAYTSGRWLRDDASKHQARFINFDFDALSRRIIQLCPGATSISQCSKTEGGNNRVFIFTTDNGCCLVALSKKLWNRVFEYSLFVCFAKDQRWVDLYMTPVPTCQIDSFRSYTRKYLRHRRIC